MDVPFWKNIFVSIDMDNALFFTDLIQRISLFAVWNLVDANPCHKNFGVHAIE
jgi:hypothetical protein